MDCSPSLLKSCTRYIQYIHDSGRMRVGTNRAPNSAVNPSSLVSGHRARLFPWASGHRHPSRTRALKMSVYWSRDHLPFVSGRRTKGRSATGGYLIPGNKQQVKRPRHSSLPRYTVSFPSVAWKMTIIQIQSRESEGPDKKTPHIQESICRFPSFSSGSCLPPFPPPE